MSRVIVIPARFASSRFPGKPLAPLRGATGEVRSLIRRSWDAAISVSGIDRVVVATDDSRIAEASEAFGAEVAMTSPDCANGTERCAEVLSAMSPAPEMVINFQGDAPLTPTWFVEDLIAGLQAHPEFGVATPVLRCDHEAVAGFLADRQAGRVGGTTAVFDRNARALYFSKEVIPYTGSRVVDSTDIPVFHHVGVYAYRPGPLAAYPGLEEGPLERNEGLEQLRFLEHGIDVLCVDVDARGARFWELNNPEDIPRIESVLAERGIP